MTKKHFILLIGALVFLIVSTAVINVLAAPRTLAPHSFESVDLQKSERIFGNNHSVPRQVQFDDLTGVTDPATAKIILDAGRNIYRYYAFSNRSSRFPPPPDIAAMLKTAPPGLCDAASAMVRTALSGRLDVGSLNLVVPFLKAPDPAIAGDNFEYHGHTIALIDFKDGGSIGIDPTYGFILISKEKLYDGAIKSGHFELFSLFDKPADTDGPLTPLRGMEIYARAATAIEADVQKGGDRLTVMTPRLIIPPVTSLVVGKRDGMNKEVSDAFGEWMGHVGYWYEKSRHIWRFRAPSPGTYEVTFYLEGGDASVVLKRDLDIDISGSGIMSTENKVGLGVQGTLRIIVNASNDFNIAFTSNSVSARLVDAIQARKITRFNNVLYTVFGKAS